MMFTCCLPPYPLAGRAKQHQMSSNRQEQHCTMFMGSFSNSLFGKTELFRKWSTALACLFSKDLFTESALPTMWQDVRNSVLSEWSLTR